MATAAVVRPRGPLRYLPQASACGVPAKQIWGDIRHIYCHLVSAGGLAVSRPRTHPARVGGGGGSTPRRLLSPCSRALKHAARHVRRAVPARLRTHLRPVGKRQVRAAAIGLHPEQHEDEVLAPPPRTHWRARGAASPRPQPRRRASARCALSSAPCPCTPPRGTRDTVAAHKAARHRMQKDSFPSDVGAVALAGQGAPKSRLVLVEQRRHRLPPSLRPQVPRRRRARSQPAPPLPPRVEVGLRLRE